VTWLGRRHIRHDGLPDAPAPAAIEASPGTYAREALGVLETVRLLGWVPTLTRAPRGDGQRVVLIPGFQSPDVVMQPLTRFLRQIGHDACTWGRGWNEGRLEEDVRAMMPRIEAWAAESGRPLALVGWSLGGVISRELARELPHAVDRIVTYGSPIVGGPSWTVTASHYGPERCARAAERTRIRELERPLQQAITAIYTRSDGIVSWPACIDRVSPRVTHVEVGSTHLGLGIDPEVWWVVARALQPRAAGA